MVTKTEALYKALLPMRIVSFDNIVEKASDIIEADQSRRYIYRKYVDRLIKMGKLQPIRKELYAVLSPFETPEKHEVDKLLIASKIRQKYYLGFHTALEYYGCASSLLNEAYICVQAKDRFDPFQYKRLNFKPVFVTDITSEIVEKPYHQTILKVSSKERTFIECIDRIRYAGGWEESIKSLEGLGGLSFEKLLHLTLKQGRESLNRRVGYVLELLKNRSPFYEHLNEKLLNKIAEKTNRSPQYLICGKKGPLNKRWNLYIPEDFEEKLRGI
ncbi:MAG TPA: type IV toxin-antitoxin system AbiEi family antitoxin [Candidatus Bathyarchaeia archaeon]|nr:type IV toxin-antitoxin system AbiEi family antitoxin [Candidatus Bathyarchaeia archaeon]